MPLTPDWSDDGRVYVDGRLTRNQARQAVCNDTGTLYRWTEARRCYMVLLKGQDALGLIPELFVSSFGKKLTYTGAKRIESGAPAGDAPPRSPSS